MATKAMMGDNKSIRDTFLYNSMNHSKYLDDIISFALSKGKVLTPDDLAFEVNTINKYYKYPLKKAVLDAFAGGGIKPVVLGEGADKRIPASLPFILAKSGSAMISYAFIDNYKSYDAKNETYSIDPKKLYCFLESAYMAMIIQKNFKGIARSNSACADGGEIFAHMFVRVLNKRYALNVDKRAYEKMLCLAAKFFMVNQLGLPSESDTVNNYALKVAEANTPYIMTELDQAFKPEAFADLASFITTIHDNAYLITQSLASLTTRELIEDFVSMYQPAAIFALEHFSYFVFNVDSVCVGAYLNNQAILEDLVGKSGARLYTSIANYQL